MPHVSLHCSPEFVGATGKGLYADVIAEIDHHVGRVFTSIGDCGLLDDTIIIFASDNGPWLSKGIHGGCADPLRSGKLSTWEGGPRVPCLFWGPGRIAQGHVCQEMVTSMDLLPTLLAMAGLDQPRVIALMVLDLSPLLLGDDAACDPQRCYPYYFRTHLQAVRQGPWKLILRRPQVVPWLVNLSPNPHISPEDDIGIPYPHLYNLRTDIGEHHDVAGEHVAVVDQMLVEAESIRKDLGDYDCIGEGVRFYDSGPRRPSGSAGGVWTSPS